MNNEFQKGLFITFEGLDGCGKSTQVALLHNKFKNKNIPCIETREPGGTKLSENIRNILKNSTLNELICTKAEMLLLQAARAQLIDELIKPSLLLGKIVVCDRYIDSSIAYQGLYIEGKEIEILNKFSTDEIKPDITFFIDTPYEVCIQRKLKIPSCIQNDRFESKGAEFFNSVRSMYLRIAKKEPNRVRVINGDRNIKEIEEEIEDILVKKYNLCLKIKL